MTADPRLLRAVVAKLIPTLSWRHHATGILQAYAAEDLRLHIWHKDLIVRRDGEIHDHRRRLKSSVLVGEIEHLRFSEGVGDVYRTHVCVGSAAGHLEPGHRAALRLESEDIISAGESYEIAPYEVHRARSDWAVTLVELTDEGDRWARIFSRNEGEPAQAFAHDAFDMAPYLDAAVSALGAP